MSRARLHASLALVAAFALRPSPANATNGYFSHGYGIASKGVGGVGVALPQDALAPADNPAGLAFVGARYDVGLSFFSPNRGYTVVGNPTGAPGTFGLAPGHVESGSKLFVIPNFGANWKVREHGYVGLAVYGNGGMNTDYPAPTYYGSTPTGVDLAQLFVAPTYAQAFGAKKNQAFGVTAIFAFQRIALRGTEAFAAFSQDPAHVSNQGYDQSLGVGYRLGYLARPTEKVSLGLSYQGRIHMQAFDSYAGILAEQGDFDVPPVEAIGLAVRVAPKVVIALDVSRIEYDQVKSIANPLIPNLFNAPLGSDGGAGFGWEDMTVFKLGVLVETAGPWTYRVGFSAGSQPVTQGGVFPSIIAPAVVEEHFTFGFSRAFENHTAFNAAFLYVPSNSIRGPNPLEAPGAQTIELEMKQWELSLGFTWGR